MKCFYHSADLDGHCSGAIVKHAYPECEMRGINYGQPFPWEDINQGETVFMVDFTLQPFEQMEKLNSMCGLIWIDHHKTEVEEAKKRKFNPNGMREIGIGACNLVWEYLFPKKTVPLAVELLARYDVWDHDDSRTLPFQYGFRFHKNTYPDNQDLWKIYLRDYDTEYHPVDAIVERGMLLLEYEEQQNAKFCTAYAFETALIFAEKVTQDTPTQPGDEILYEYPAICVNRGFTNSKVFDSVYDPEKHDLMITFCRLKLPAKKWTVSLYSTKPRIDCGEIARHFGGGGHKGAAGFSTDILPFEH